MKPVSTNLPAQPIQIASARMADVHHAIASCERCPRLREYCRRIAREKKRAHHLDTYWGRPVPGFGDLHARLLLVGLAPAAHGANRTGRLFTGDGSGDFLMSALHRTGFANLATSRSADDGLELRDAYVVAAVRCAPPDNKPRPDEITRCLDHLEAEVAQLPRVQVVIALGRIGFDAWLQLLRRRGIAMSPRPPFAHGSVVEMGPPDRQAVPTLIGCYHPSRQNTNTGRLTAAMMDHVFTAARAMIGN